MKKLRWLGQLLCLVILANALAACGRADLPTPTIPSNQIIRPTPTVVKNNSVSTLAAMAPTASLAQPTVTPLSSPSPVASGQLPNTPNPNGDDDLPSPEEIAPGLGDGEGGGNLTAENAPDNLGASDLPQGGLGASDLPAYHPAPTASSTTSLKANYGAKGQPKIGLQVGHWMIANLPDELARLRTQTGGSGGGVREVDVNMDIARRVMALLQKQGYEVDLLPATVPINYTADAFVAIHADATTDPSPSGYKLARSRFSAIPNTDDALLNSIYLDYQVATGMSRSDSITANMTSYYAFDNRHDLYSVNKITPSVIVETGYLTNAVDRLYLTSQQDRVAAGIANGIIDFIKSRPGIAQRESAVATMPGVEIATDNTAVLDKANSSGTKIAQVAKGDKFESYGVRDGYYLVWLPSLRRTGFIAQADVNPTTLPR